MSDSRSPDRPDTWKKLTIKEIATLGRKPPSSLLDGKVEVSFLPMACVEEESGRIQLGQVISATEGKRRSLTYFEDGDVLFAKITPCMENGKVAVAKGLQNGAAFGSSEFYVLCPQEETVLPEYLNFVLVDPSFRSEAARAMTGAVGQQRVPRRFIEDFQLGIPPLSEQREIVRILEEQFSRLDAAAASIAAVRRKAEQFRRSILHAAFDGSLTGGKESWSTATLDQLLDVSIGGVWGEEAGISEVDVDVVRVTELRPHGVVDNSTAVRRSVTRKQLETRELKIDDLLLEKSGGGPNTPVGRVGRVLRIDRPTVCSNFMQLMRPDSSKVRAAFLHHFLVFFHADGRTIPLQTSTTNIRNIKTNDYQNTDVPLPPLSEQDEVLDVVERHLAHLRMVLAETESLEKKMTALRRSLLHSALSGGLTREWREKNHG